MGTELKPAGKAVANAKGHYPDASGRHLAIAPGETFVVWEGATKGKWFTLLPNGATAPKVQKEAPPAGPDTLAAAAVAERKRKAAVKPPTEDDIA